MPSLWAGTNGGCVFAYMLRIPTMEHRAEEGVTAQPGEGETTIVDVVVLIAVLSLTENCFWFFFPSSQRDPANAPGPCCWHCCPGRPWRSTSWAAGSGTRLGAIARYAGLTPPSGRVRGAVQGKSMGGSRAQLLSFFFKKHLCLLLPWIFFKYLVYFNSCIYQHLPTCYTCTVPFSSLTSTTSILEKIAWFKISDILLLLVCYQWPKLRNFSADILCKKFDSIKINGLQ